MGEKTRIKKDKSEKLAVRKKAVEGKIISQEEWNKLQKNPTVSGVLDAATGLIATALDKPSEFVFSGRRLVDALLSGRFRYQVTEEMRGYKDKGQTPIKNLNSKIGTSIFVELMKVIDEGNLDDEKFEALKSIYIKSVWKGADGHKQMLAYQYFQVCKKLSSLDILVLKTAFDIYEEPKGSQVRGGISKWEREITKKLGVPRELIVQSRLKNSGINQNPSTMVFDAEQSSNRHGLTELGIAIGKFIK
ncbi:hypothetical protein ACFL18_02170 [Patescibacteria group bacterium]